MPVVYDRRGPSVSLITSSILGRYGSLRNDFLVTRDMNSHRLTTPLTHRIQEKTCQASWDVHLLFYCRWPCFAKYFRAIVIFISASRRTKHV